jgi:hypothetical protein
VGDARWARFQKKLEDINKLREYLQNTRRGGMSLWEQLRRPGSKVAGAPAENPDIKKMGFDRDVLQAVAIDAKYRIFGLRRRRSCRRLGRGLLLRRAG